jgi:hypothetical protein
MRKQKAESRNREKFFVDIFARVALMEDSQSMLSCNPWSMSFSLADCGLRSGSLAALGQLGMIFDAT